MVGRRRLRIGLLAAILGNALASDVCLAEDHAPPFQFYPDPDVPKLGSLLESGLKVSSAGSAFKDDEVRAEIQPASKNFEQVAIFFTQEDANSEMETDAALAFQAQYGAVKVGGSTSFRDYLKRRYSERTLHVVYARGQVTSSEAFYPGEQTKWADAAKQGMFFVSEVFRGRLLYVHYRLKVRSSESAQDFRARFTASLRARVGEVEAHAARAFSENVRSERVEANCSKRAIGAKLPTGFVDTPDTLGRVVDSLVAMSKVDLDAGETDLIGYSVRGIARGALSYLEALNRQRALRDAFVSSLLVQDYLRYYAEVDAKSDLLYVLQGLLEKHMANMLAGVHSDVDALCKEAEESRAFRTLMGEPGGGEFACVKAIRRGRIPTLPLIERDVGPVMYSVETTLRWGSGYGAKELYFWLGSTLSADPKPAMGGGVKDILWHSYHQADPGRDYLCPPQVFMSYVPPQRVTLSLDQAWNTLGTIDGWGGAPTVSCERSGDGELSYEGPVNFDKNTRGRYEGTIRVRVRPIALAPILGELVE